MADNAPVVQHALHIPLIDDVSSVLQKGLEKNFAEVSVKVVNCPDLTQAPFYLAKSGLSGSQKVVDVGGPPYLLPLVDKTKLYDVVKLATQVGTTSGLAVGAGAGPHPLIGVNSEMMCNVALNSTANADVKSYIAKLKPDKDCAVLQKLDSSQFALMANLYMSEGLAGKVLEVKASKRTGELNYMSCIREVLAQHYGDKPVALGGTFLVEKGKAKLHVMSDFSACPLTTTEEINNWLKFYEYDAPLTAVGYLVSHDPGWDLRIEHFHCFSDHGVGGHYHYDVTPDEVEYRGYFNIAEALYRVDAPVNTHQFGRD